MKTIKNKYTQGFATITARLGKRQCESAFFFEEDISLVQSGVNGCDYEGTRMVIAGLESVKRGEVAEFEWGGSERTWFISECDYTEVIDNFSWEENFSLPTDELLLMMIQKLEFMEQWTPSKIRNLLGRVFEAIGENRSLYLSEPNSSIFIYWDEKSQTRIYLALLPEDFELSRVEFENSLTFDSNAFPPLPGQE